MLYYDRIDVSEGINFTTSNTHKEYMICYYWIYNHGSKFQDYAYNGSHVLI